MSASLKSQQLAYAKTYSRQRPSDLVCEPEVSKKMVGWLSKKEMECMSTLYLGFSKETRDKGLFSVIRSDRWLILAWRSEKGVSRAQKHALHKDKEEEKTC
jgi:hypothetical protein